jgi:hypothetical protein
VVDLGVKENVGNRLSLTEPGWRSWRRIVAPWPRDWSLLVAASSIGGGDGVFGLGVAQATLANDNKGMRL